MVASNPTQPSPHALDFSYAPRGGLMQQVNREGVLVLAGGRALLLQIAHPAVAAGVSQHSRWKATRYQRLFRTLWLTNQLLFGRPAVRQQAAKTINKRHATVRGEVNGQPYRASDPRLGWWVLATLIDSTLVAYQHWVRPLTPAELESLYAEYCQMAAVFGVRPEMMPPNYLAFQAWFAATLTDGTLAYDATNCQMAHDLFDLPWPLRPFTYGLTMLLTPEPVSQGFGLPWSATDAERWTARSAQLGRWYRRLPIILRENIFSKLARWR